MFAIPPARLPQWRLNPCDHCVGDLREIYGNTWCKLSIGSHSTHEIFPGKQGSRAGKLLFSFASRPPYFFILCASDRFLHAERLQTGRRGKLDGSARMDAFPGQQGSRAGQLLFTISEQPEAHHQLAAAQMLFNQLLIFVPVLVCTSNCALRATLAL